MTEENNAQAASELTREYSTDAITIQWYATRCIHSANCVRALHRVFDPKRRPWIEPEGVDADSIAAAVLRCPSGALHFVRHDGGAQETPDMPTTFMPVQNGPLYARGNVEAHDINGGIVRRDTRIALCGCGRSARAPFCDTTCHTEPAANP